MKVKRMLAGSLGRRGKTFGVRLDELVVRAVTEGHQDAVPIVVIRLCNFIEAHGLENEGLFRLSGNQKVVERLRSSFDRVGDADLEGCGDVAAAAALLKLFLRELPEPAIPDHTAAELLSAHEKLADEPSEYVASMRRLTSQLPDPNRELLRYLTRFLYRVSRHEPHNRMGPSSLGIVFGPNLLRVVPGYRGLHQQTLSNQLVARLIADYSAIFEASEVDSEPRLVDHTIQAAVAEHLFGDTPTEPEAPQRKRKERHESTSQSQERKVIRSNSEERPLEDEIVSSKDSIRRVSSHEDVTLKGKNHSFLQEIHDPSMGQGVRSASLPLHEHNPPSVPPPALGSSSEDLGFLGDMDDEHEKRRNSERFASFPRSVAPRGRRSQNRRRRAHRNEDQDGGGSSKENEDRETVQAKSNHQQPHSMGHQTAIINSNNFGSSTSDDDSSQDANSKSHSFLRLHPQRDIEDRSPSPSPSTPRKMFMPPLDLTTLHQQVDCGEPLTSQGNWTYTHRAPDDSHVMLSPRNSMILTRRTYLDPNIPPSPPLDQDVPRHKRIGEHDGHVSRVKQVTKQINSLKRKIKQHEEEFERQFGYRPSHSDKMVNRDMKKMMGELNKLRKELKQIKEDPHSPVMSTQSLEFVSAENIQRSGLSRTSANGKTVHVEDTLLEVGNRLNEKRQQAGRPENMEELTREQLLDEKVAVQKALLYLESIHGRPASRDSRDLVRPLYDRYRSLKRLVVRSGSSKLKDSVTELATILEHETMDFTQASPQHQFNEAETSEPADPEPDQLNEIPTVTVSASDVDQPDVKKQSKGTDLENLHALPLSDLLQQQRETREEKKKLRRALREFEEEFQRVTGKKVQREDRITMETVYSQYKQAKAKLRLLEALVAKHGSGGDCSGV